MRCLDRRVLIGLAAIGAAVLVARPDWLGVVLPLLVVLACPLSMHIMMRTGATRTGAPASSGSDHELDELRSEIARLRGEVERRRASHDA